MTPVILRSQIQVCLTPRPYFSTAWHYPPRLGKHYCVPGNESAVFLEDRRILWYPASWKNGVLPWCLAHWCVCEIFPFPSFSCSGFRNTNTQNSRVYVDGSDFGETVAWPLTDIWKRRHQGSCPKSKARWQPDRSQPLQMPSPSMMDSRLGTHTRALRLISNHENCG